MIINRFRLTIEPSFYTHPDRRLRVTIESEGEEPIHDEMHFHPDSFESEFEYYMKHATHRIKEYIEKMKKDEKMRSMSVEEMKKLTEELLELPNDPED